MRIDIWHRIISGVLAMVMVFAFGAKDFHHLFESHHHEVCQAKTDKHYHEKTEFFDCLICTISINSEIPSKPSQTWNLWTPPTKIGNSGNKLRTEQWYHKTFPRGPPKHKFIRKA